MSGAIPVRVTVLDTWDAVTLRLPPDTPIGMAKADALRAVRAGLPPGEYVAKHRGAELLDEAASLASAGIPPNGSIILLPRRRIPAR